MTNEQAVNTLLGNGIIPILKKSTDKRKKDERLILNGQIEAIKMGADALRKQIPQKPREETYFYGKIYYCPLCERSIDKDVFVPPSFCQRCGQAIDWW